MTAIILETLVQNILKQLNGSDCGVFVLQVILFIYF